MSLQTTRNVRPEDIAGKAELRLRDVALVAFAIACVVFGNIAIVRAMDVALDTFVIAAR